MRPSIATWYVMTADTAAGAGAATACLRPGGPLTMSTAHAFRRAIRRQTQAGVRSLWLDLRSVSAIDAAGVAALVEGARAVEAVHGEIRVATNALVNRALKLTRTIAAFRPWRPEVDG